ncbi:MAG: hypothetical protein WC979_03700 [Candidatus Pacearchaeota archaeon]|jgi:hypothetical protein
MRNYNLPPRKEPVSNQNSIQYSIGLLEKSLGIVRVFGLDSIPQGVRSILDYAIRRGDLSQEQLELADLKYHQEYAKKSLERLFY